MSVVLVALAVGVVLLLPAAGAVRRARIVVPGLGGARAVALLYSGVGISAWILWLAGRFVAFSPWVILAVSLLVAGLLSLGAGGLSTGAARSPRRPGTAPSAGQPGTDSSAGRAGAAPPVERTGGDRDPWSALLLVGAVFAVLVLVPFFTYGLERADGIHRMAMTDWYKHLVVTTAVDGSPEFPPANPFLHTMEEPAYYFGFHLLAASLNRLAGLGGLAGSGGGPVGGPVDVYHLLVLLTVLTAVALPFVVFLVARDLTSRREALLAAVGGTLLAGFDLVVVALDTLRATVASWPLPAGLAGLRAAVPSTHLDYWIHHNERQFNAAYVATTWAPQHTAGALLALLAWWLLSPHDDRPDRPRSGPLLPALLLAGLPAISAYVALGLGLALAGVTGVQCWRRRCLPWSTPVVRRWWRAGLVALVLALPILSTLGTGTGSSSGLVLHVSDAGDWTNGALFSWLFGESWWARLLDTPAVYLVEFGVVGLLAVLEVFAMRRRRRASEASSTGPVPAADPDFGPGRTTLARETLAAVATILVVAAVVRPPLDGPNNLYARPTLLAFLLLTPFAARRAARHLRSRWLLAGVAICALGTAYALVGTVVEGSLFWAYEPDLVASCRWINRETPEDSVVAVDPDDYQSGFGYFLRRRLLVADERHALLLGATPLEFEATAAALDEAYAAASPEAAAARFDELGTGVLLVHGDRAPAWARSACFQEGHRGGDWSVVLRVPGTCAPPATR